MAMIIIPTIIQARLMYKKFLALSEAFTHSLVTIPLTIAVATQAVLKIAYPTVFPISPNLKAA